MERNIRYLQQWDITDVVVNIHHFADQITSAITENNGWGSHITISDESDAVLETGGGLLYARHLLEDSDFVTINADILTDLDLGAMIRHHREQAALVTLAVTNRTTSRYLLFDEHHQLCGWRNTTSCQERLAVAKDNLTPMAYSGIAVFSPRIFELMEQRGKFSLIDVYLSLAANHKLIGFDHSGGKLVDVGKPESVPVAETLFGK